MNNIVEIENKVLEIETLFNQFLVDAKKNVEMENKSAGVRARKTSLEIEKLLKEYRKISIEATKE